MRIGITMDHVQFPLEAFDFSDICSVNFSGISELVSLKMNKLVVVSIH